MRAGLRSGDLGGQYDFVARLAVGEPLADGFFGGTARIGFGGVEEVDAVFEGTVHYGEGALLVDFAAESDAA